MNTKKNNPDRLEERSDKMRNLLGEQPPFMVRWGTVVVAFTFLMLFIALCLLPYPYSGGETIFNHFIK